jgi:hypothetical protein
MHPANSFKLPGGPTQAEVSPAANTFLISQRFCGIAQISCSSYNE